MPTTTDPNDTRLGYGFDTEPTLQNAAYLVLSEEERTKGFVRPVRHAYKHVGLPEPQYPLFDLTGEQKELWGNEFAKFERYPDSESPLTGRYWTQAELDLIDGGCGSETIMSTDIAETYARNPQFYGATYCAYCHKHRPVAEFVWSDDGTRVGS